MITTRIKVKPHLREYVSGKFNQFRGNAVRFPDNLDIYHAIFDLTIKRPVNCPVDEGNLEIILPKMDSYKQPKTYNYLSIQSQKKIEKKIEIMFWAEVRDFIDSGRHKNGSPYSNLVYDFLNKYCINSISEDALIKHYYRYRKKTRNNEKRAYVFKKK